MQTFIPASNRCLKRRLGCSDHRSTKSLWSDKEKRLHINVLELKAVSLALQSFKDQCQNQTVLVATDNSGSLHKQTRRNSLSRVVCSRVEDHDMVPSLTHNIKIQTHSRVSECAGRPVQVEPSAVNRMVTASTGVQTDLSKVVHSSCRSICHSSEPQSSTVRISSPRPKCLGHRCPNLNWMGLTAYACPPMALLHRVIQKIRQCHCLIIVIAPGWPGMPWFWDLVQLSTDHQGPSTSQSGPYLRNGAEKIQWLSPLHL